MGPGFLTGRPVLVEGKSGFGALHGEDSMSLNPPPFSFATIEHRIRELVDLEGVLTFTALTTQLPSSQWITLFRALNHLEKQQVIRLIPLPWDYQICAATRAMLPLNKG